MEFTLAMPAAALALALWFDARFASVRPTSLAQSFVHTAMSMFALFSAVGLLELVYGIPQTLFIVVTLTVFMPALVYAVIAGVWLLRAFATAARAGA
jgi:hypothetical protein